MPALPLDGRDQIKGHLGYGKVLFHKSGLYPYIVILFTLLINLLIPACNKTPAIRETNQFITLAQPSRPMGIDLSLLIDESGSMFGDKGTDPEGLRYEASKYLAQNLLVKKSDPDFPHRISVIHFGDTTLANDFIDISPGNAAQISEIIHFQQPRHLGDTSFINALRVPLPIYRRAPVYENPRRRIIIIFTNGRPDDSRRLPIAQYFRELEKFIKQELAAFELFIIGVDNSRLADNWGASRDYWANLIGSTNLYHMTDMRELYTKFNEVIRSIFEIPEVKTNIITDETSFQVTPYLEKIEFHVFPQPRVRLAIYKPDGAQAKGTITKGDDYYIVTVPDPPVGLWKYKIIEGQGNITVFRNPLPFKLQLFEPLGVYPLGKPFLPKAIFAREDGSPIKEHPDFPLSFAGKVIDPDGKEENIEFPGARKLGDIYYANKEVGTSRPGDYRIRLMVKGGTQFEAVSTQKVFVQSFPYMKLERPYYLKTYPLSRELDIKLILKREGKPTEPEKEFEEHPNQLIMAQLVDPKGKSRSRAIWLNYKGGGIFQGIIPNEMKEPGSYRLALQMAGTARFPSQLIPSKSIELVDFYIKPSLGQIWFCRAKNALGIIMLCIIFSLISVSLWLFRSPKITANLEVARQSGESEAKFLNNSRWIKPWKIRGYEFEGASCPSITIWLKARDDNSIRVYRGGWLSLLTFGLMSKKRFNLSRDESYDLSECFTMKLS